MLKKIAFNNILRYILIFSLLFIISFDTFSQYNEKQELAFDYYRNKEYEKASSLFNELYKEQNNTLYLNYYIYCLLQLAKYEQAEEVVKNELKKKNNDIPLQILLGNIYKLWGKYNEMNKIYENILKKINSQDQVFTAANYFIQYQEYNLAEQVYLKGQKISKGSYPYYLELASLYQVQKLYDKMIDQYFLLLESNPSFIQSVQNRLQQTVYQDVELVKLFQSKLIDYIQKNPDKTIFTELLIWLYTQQGNFEKALTYSKALDKRNKEDGSRVYSLAQVARANKDYQTALKAYEYIISKGASSSWYFEAKDEYLLVLYNQVLNGTINDKTTIQELENQLIQHLKQPNNNKNMFSIIIATSRIQAFHLNKTEEAKSNLQTIIDKPTIFSNNQINEAKLLLGDILLYENNIWEATLYYTQVEKSSTNEPLTHEAKYKKALLAYYTGDFLWAQAQMDVLKASTSKLIANDAFALSQFISENEENDSSEKSLQYFAKADYYIFKNQDSIALIYLDSLLSFKSYSSLFDDALLRKADIYSKKNQYQLAIALYDSVASYYKYEITAPSALYKIANIYQYINKDKDKAMTYLNKLFTDYPGSFYADECRKRYRMLRGDLIENISSEEISVPYIP